MTRSPHPPFSLGRIEELLDLIAHLLGFIPDTSMVMVGIDDADALVAVGRLELTSTGDQLRTAVDSIAAADSTRVVLVGYGDEQPVHATLTAALQALRANGIRAVGAVRVSDRQYWPLTGQSLRAASGAVPYQPGTSAAATAAVFAGLVALPDRNSLAATLNPVTGADRDRMTGATTHAEKVLAPLMDAATGDPHDAGAAAQRRAAHHAGTRLLTEVEQLYQRGQSADDGQAATLSILLTLAPLRDAAARRTSGHDWQRAMWIDLLRRAEARYTAAPATLLALCALHDGWGTLAAIAVDRALKADPGYRYAQLLSVAMAAGIAPHIITDTLTQDPA